MASRTPSGKLKLNDTEKEVRRLLVRSRGKMSNVEIAKKLGKRPSYIWVCRRNIEKVSPLPDFEHDLPDEIRSALEAFDELEQNAIQKYDDVSARLEDTTRGDRVVGLLQIQVSLTNQILRVRNDRINFLKSIGLLGVEGKRWIQKYRDQRGDEQDFTGGVLAVPLMSGNWEEDDGTTPTVPQSRR